MDNENIIYAYTRQDAINDGVFIEVNEMAKEAGFKIPVCVTANLYHKYIKPDPMPDCQDENGRLWDVLWMLYIACKQPRAAKQSLIDYKVIFDGKEVKLFAAIEAQSMDDPSPAINIMLPEDY